MIRKSLHCPICGDVWRKVLYEHFLRLGPPTRECRACWSRFPTGNREWNDLDATTRTGYLLQSVVLILPLLALLVLACVFCYLFGLADDIKDLQAYFLAGCGILLGCFLLSLLWSLLAIVRSKHRSSRRAPQSTSNPAG